MRTSLVICMILAALADLVCLAAAPYSDDEIVNLDAAITFLKSGDYTTARFDSTPFTPAISSGVVATLLPGSVLLANGSLISARLVTGLALLICAAALLATFLRRQGFDGSTAVLLSLAVWLSLPFLPADVLRLTHPAELWGAVLLGAGLLATTHSTILAAVLWGLATWLCKSIYLPFGLLLLVAAIIQRSSGTTAAIRSRIATTHLAAFLSPLISWIVIISLRHDVGTAGAWVAASVDFALRHATGSEVAGGLSSLPGWSFRPNWPREAFFDNRIGVILRWLSPLGLGLSASGAWLASKHTRRRGPALSYLIASSFGVLVFTLWFLTFDPTGWQRHLLPAAYVSIGILVFCTVDAWQALERYRPARAVVRLVVAIILLSSAAHSLDRLTSISWEGSYAVECRGSELLRPPCFSVDWSRRDLLVLLAREMCAQPACPRESLKSFFRYAWQIQAAKGIEQSYVCSDTQLACLIK